MTVSDKQPQRLRLGALIALVVGSMIGGGIFSLPQNIATSAGAGAVLLGWLVTGVGMLALAFVFQTLSRRKPELDAGVYAYAKAGFGAYMGFNSAWGYWICAWIGNVSYFVLLFSSLGFFFPVFGEGNTPAAVICASVLLWMVHAMVLSGVRQAAFINIITTVAKIVPLIMFVVLAFVGFKADLFSIDIWGVEEQALGSVLDQVRNMMLVTVWVFIGIEGASVYSSRAQNRSDVGKATVLGFIGVLALLVMVNVLSMGVLSRAELAGLKNPSMAGVLEVVVGAWGSKLINVGLIISLCGALLSWTMLSAEILCVAAKDGAMPKALARTNSRGSPRGALWLSNTLIQVFLIITLFSSGTYLDLLYLGSSMILLPYFWTAFYALMLCLRGETYGDNDRVRGKDFAIALVAVLYSLWLVYAGGVKYLLLSSILYAPGAVVFAIARREQGERVFTPLETGVLVVLIMAALAGIAGLYMGYLSL
ncbi:arginine-ornithine antiporter [Hahella sp. HN01]|uniref:arginine-ornithine antiporter n=1 Tax=Hahella sp. HN01 TaxID=2847262 RepID=UPI001C1EFD3C|nr:arginine-ornithine antiporter [Hahella sp. HN01]MBU6950142.1 arginine-ornithine antiporter [Hahella sp. HN01]